MPEGKEAETSETFDEDAYRDELIDKEDYSDESARMKAKKKKEMLERRAAKIEINLGSLAKKRVSVKATATRKAHYRTQETGKKDKISSKERSMANMMINSDKSYEVKMGQYILDGNKGMVSTMRQGFPNAWKKYEDMVKSEDTDYIEHLSPEERKKRREQRDKQQKERAAHRAGRKKQHEEVEVGIPEGK